jgi:hypothetical protein
MTRSCRSIDGHEVHQATAACARIPRRGLATLKPAFLENGTVTAGTSSPLTDGAAAVLVCSADYAKAQGPGAARAHPQHRGLRLRAGVMGIGPVRASARRSPGPGSAVADLDVIELNEAFASQSLACIKELGLDARRVKLDGGAIALGHPLGATGARITGKAAALLRREGGRYALATQCIGGGQGIATVLEAADGHREGRRDRRRRDGRRHRRARRQCRCAGGAARHRPGGATDRSAIAEGAIAALLKADPAPSCTAQRALVTRATPRTISRWLADVRLDRRGRDRARRHQARRSTALDEAAQARRHRLLQHLHHPARAALTEGMPESFAATS